jgi:hypothetical protein
MSDGDGGTSNVIKQLVSVAGPNASPVLSDVLGTKTYSENGALLAVLSTKATVQDVDSSDLLSGRLTVTITVGKHSQDVLAVINQGTGSGKIGVSGTSVTYSGVVIGSLSGGTSGTPLSVSLTSVSATPAALQALIRAIGYRSESENPPQDPRQVSFVLTDGDGGTSNTLTQSVAVRAFNDAPTLRQSKGLPPSCCDLQGQT